MKKNDSQLGFDFESETVETLAEKQKKEQEALEAVKKAEEEKKKAEEILSKERLDIKNLIKALIDFNDGKKAISLKEIRDFNEVEDDEEQGESEEESNEE